MDGSPNKLVALSCMLTSGSAILKMGRGSAVKFPPSFPDLRKARGMISLLLSIVCFTVL